MNIRFAIITDVTSITEIYNESILNTTATFDTEPKTGSEQLTWFQNHGKKYPILVAEQNNFITGWASLSRWSERCAYEDTTEISVYIHKEHRRKGIAKLLMQKLMEEGKKAGLHSVIARITEGNDVSVRLHEKFGFTMVGTLKEAGKKFGKLLDVIIMQKML